MALTLFVVLVGWCTWALGRALFQLRLFTQLPTLFAAVYAGYVLPQAYALLGDPGLPPGALAKVLLIALLVLVFVNLGWAVARGGKKTIQEVEYNKAYLVAAVGAMSLIGLGFSVWLARLPVELTGVSQWTGIPTILVFFAKFQNFAFALSLLVWLRERKPAPLFWALFNAAFLLPPALLDARRESIIEIVLIIFVALWFTRRYVPPRSLVVLGALSLVVLVNSASDIRQILSVSDDNGLRHRANVSLQDFRQLDVGATLEQKDPIYSELGGAARIVDAVDEKNQNTWGFRIWDTLIFNYVPGQWIGFENKSALQIYPIGIPESLGVQTGLGTVITAFADTYDAFWYAGAAVYFLVGLVFGKMYKAANKGSLLFQYFYIVSVTVALLSITHGFLVFPARAPALILFSAPAFVFAFQRLRGKRRVEQMPIDDFSGSPR